MEAIILAGGFGTRLQPVVSEVPKAMALINGRPFLEYQLDWLIAQGFSKIILAVGYKREVIIGHFAGQYRSATISYSVEEEPMGTGGAIRMALWKAVGPRVLVLNGDTIFRIPLQQLIDQHLRRKADITLAVRKIDDAGRYGEVVLNRNYRVTGFREKNENSGEGLINAGIYVLEKIFLMEPWYRGKFSIEKDCFEKVYKNSKIYGHPCEGYFLDIGIPEDYDKAQHDFQQFED